MLRASNGDTPGLRDRAHDLHGRVHDHAHRANKASTLPVAMLLLMQRSRQLFVSCEYLRPDEA